MTLKAIYCILLLFLIGCSNKLEEEQQQPSYTSFGDYLCLEQKVQTRTYTNYHQEKDSIISLEGWVQEHLNVVDYWRKKEYDSSGQLSKISNYVRTSQVQEKDDVFFNVYVDTLMKDVNFQPVTGIFLSKEYIDLKEYHTKENRISDKVRIQFDFNNSYRRDEKRNKIYPSVMGLIFKDIPTGKTDYGILIVDKQRYKLVPIREKEDFLR